MLELFKCLPLEWRAGGTDTRVALSRYYRYQVYFEPYK